VKDEIKFSTIDEMAQWTVQHPSYDIRLKLVSNQWNESGWVIENWNGYRGEYFHLSDELGKQLDTLWTKKPACHGSKTMVNTGTRTLTGILKLLGRDDIIAQVKEARQKQEDEQERIKRNNIRRGAKEKVVELKHLIAGASAFGIDLPAPDFGPLLAELDKVEE